MLAAKTKIKTINVKPKQNSINEDERDDLLEIIIKTGKSPKFFDEFKQANQPSKAYEEKNKSHCCVIC